MGAALLTIPDLDPDCVVDSHAPGHYGDGQGAFTPKLVKRTVNMGIRALTVYCRTRTMRDRDTALGVCGRLGMGNGIEVIDNGDCTGTEDGKRIRELIAAESNPRSFLPNVEKTLRLPSYATYFRSSYPTHGFQGDWTGEAEFMEVVGHRGAGEGVRNKAAAVDEPMLFTPVGVVVFI
ncbi:FMN-linked oxidoreductase [Mycena kentingensis (nom. inval.)]|nr:FMN-linked oxidoreductase [Mycena kentingensis (nom. inval.)]